MSESLLCKHTHWKKMTYLVLDVKNHFCENNKYIFSKYQKEQQLK